MCSSACINYYVAMTNILKCGKCELEIKGRERHLRCYGFCELSFHQSCSGLSDVAFKVVAEKSSIFWSCDNCGIGKNCSLRKMFNDYEKAFMKLSSEIKNQQLAVGKGEAGMSYADKLKSKKYEPVLVIKPKSEGQTSTTTKEEVKRLIDPTEIEISGLKNVSNGGIVIECKNEQAVAKLREEAHSKLGDKYNVNEPKKRKPYVKIIGMREHRSPDDIVNKIKSQNHFLDTEKVNIRVTHVARMRASDGRSARYLAYAEVDATNYQRMLEEKKINIGWDICKVFSAVTVTRCFKCCGYNHKAKECRKEMRCPRCAGSHNVKDCNVMDEEMKCINCIETVSKLNLNIGVNHAAWDPECPVFKRKLQVEERKIDFLG